MASEQDAIIAKIKKCLALSTSSNAHEAEIALRQARRLMESNGISDLDMQAAEAGARFTSAGAKVKPANWEAALASRVGNAFGCRVMFCRGGGNHAGMWLFVGCGAASEVGQYAFDVLRRQAARARTEHIKLNLRRCNTATKTRRADLFSDGWVQSVAGTIGAFAGSAQQSAAIAAYVDKHYPVVMKSLETNKRNGGRNLSGNEIGDFLAGRSAGKDARLDRGVGSADERVALN